MQLLNSLYLQSMIIRCPNAPDLVATFFALAGVKAPSGLHGRDLTGLLKNPAADWPHPCLYEHVGDHLGDDVARVLKTAPGTVSRMGSAPVASSNLS